MIIDIALGLVPEPANLPAETASIILCCEAVAGRTRSMRSPAGRVSGSQADSSTHCASAP